MERKQTGLGLTLKPNAHLSVALRADRNDITLREGRFYTQVPHGLCRLQFHAERIVAEPPAVRQRDTAPELSESLPLDS